MKYFFKKKNITDPSVGETLQAQRQQKKLSLEAASAATKISVKYLTALENGDYKNLPDGVYARNFLREYCYYLKLDCKYLLESFKEEINLVKIEEKDRPVFSRQLPKRQYFFSLPKVTRNIILLIAIILGFVYLGLRIEQVIAPYRLTIDFPPENYVTSERKITLTGQAEREARLFVNNQDVFSDETGRFSQEVNLKEGLNVITVKAKKKYGREATAVRQVLVK